MRKLFAFLFFALFLAPAPLGARSFSRGRIVVHPGGRYLQYADGRPFFYLGDTAWELFHRTTREEARLYLEDRARKGFTVIQAVCLAERDGLRVPNAYGDLPFADAGFTRPNERYFTYVDEVVAMADSLGLVIGLLPAWGDKFCLKWGPGPEIFTTEGRAEAFGRYLGERYRIRRNIIWILGGDRPPEGREPILRAFARGIACGVAGREDYSACLITYHPWGKSSSGDWLHDEPWLAFNMQQNGHAYDFDLWERIARDYARRPVKPVLDGEPIYEEHPIDFDRENTALPKPCMCGGHSTTRSFPEPADIPTAAMPYGRCGNPAGMRLSRGPCGAGANPCRCPGLIRCAMGGNLSRAVRFSAVFPTRALSPGMPAGGTGVVRLPATASAPMPWSIPRADGRLPSTWDGFPGSGSWPGGTMSAAGARCGSGNSAAGMPVRR